MPQRVAAPASIDHPGDEALTAEHLVCTEEERVRLPPSPCPPPMPALPASARDSTIDTFSPHESPSRKAKRCDGVRRVAAPTTHASVVSRAARTLRTVAAQVRLLPEALFTNARSSEDEHRRAKAVDAGSTPAGRIARGRCFNGRAPGRQLGGARSIRAVRFAVFAGLWCNGEHRELQPRWSGFESWWACLSPCTTVAGRSGSVISRQKAPGPAVRIRIPTASHDRDETPLLLRAETGPVIDS